jgi:hypothetical protein
MIIYKVEYTTPYGHNEIIDYFHCEFDAEQQRELTNKNNPGINAFITEVYVN